MKRKCIVFILLGLITYSASGQSFLVLEKMGTKKRYEYYPGDLIDLKQFGDTYFTRYSIIGLRDSSIYTDGEQLKIASITEVQLKNRSSFLKYAGPVLMGAGLTLFAIDALNQTVVQGGGYEYSSGVVIASASLIGVGAIFTFAGRNKVKVKKWWRLRVVEI